MEPFATAGDGLAHRNADDAENPACGCHGDLWLDGGAMAPTKSTARCKCSEVGRAAGTRTRFPEAVAKKVVAWRG